MSEHRVLYRGTLYPIRAGELMLGRSSYASVVVNNPLASREHALIRATAAGLEVVDLGSRNATFVNGRRVEGTAPLMAGDRLRIGTETLDVVRVAPEDREVLALPTIPGTVEETLVGGGSPESLDLAEALVRACLDSAQRRSTADAVLRLLDAFVHATSPSARSPEDSGRIRSVIDTVAAWELGEPIAASCRGLEVRLGTAVEQHTQLI